MKAMRFNLFKSVHKGLRGLIADTLIQLQKTDFLVNVELLSASERIKLILMLTRTFTKWKQDVIFPALGENYLDLISYFNNQYDQNDTLTLGLDILLSNIEEAKDDSDREVIANQILCAFIEFTTCNFNRMSMEEQLIPPSLWHQYHDRELEKLVSLFLHQSKNNSYPIFLEWMLRHNTTHEVDLWLNGLKAHAPLQQFTFIDKWVKANNSLQRMV